MLTLSAKRQRILASRGGSDYPRVRVKNSDGAWVNLDGWVVSAEWTRGADGVVGGATIELWASERHRSLALNVTGSPFNRNAAGAYAPLIDVATDIQILTASEPRGYQPTTWTVEFDGYVRTPPAIGDTIRVEAFSNIGKLDRGVGLLDRKYGGPPVDGVPIMLEDVAESIMDDSGFGGLFTLWFPSPSGWEIGKTYTVSQRSPLGALADLLQYRGWVIRERKDEALSAWRIALYRPDYERVTPHWTFPAGKYTRAGGETNPGNDVQIVNDVEVSFLNAATGERETVYAEDAASIAAYGGEPAGRRKARVVLKDDSPIDSPAEAQEYADTLVLNLALPETSMVRRVPYMPEVEVDDCLAFEPDGGPMGVGHHDITLLGYVVNYTHVFPQATDAGVEQPYTDLVLSGRPSGQYFKYVLTTRRPPAADVAVLEQPVPSYPSAGNFSLTVRGNDQTAGILRETNAGGTWGSPVEEVGAVWTFGGAQSTSGIIEYRFSPRNLAGVLGTARKYVDISRYIAPLPPVAQCRARIIDSDATTVTVQGDAVPVTGTVTMIGVTGGASLLSGPAVGVASPSGTVWVFHRAVINAGAGQAEFLAEATGHQSDRGLATIEEQGRDTVPLLMRATVFSNTTTQMVIRVPVADPYPGGSITVTYTAQGTGSISPASPQTLTGTVTSDIETTAYIDFTVLKAAVASPGGSVTFMATSPGRTFASDPVTVPAVPTQPAPIQPPLHSDSLTIADDAFHYTFSGVAGAGGTGTIQVRVEDMAGTALAGCDWQAVPLAKTFYRAFPPVSYRKRLRYANATSVESSPETIFIQPPLDGESFGPAGEPILIHPPGGGTPTDGGEIATTHAAVVGTLDGPALIKPGVQASDGAAYRGLPKGMLRYGLRNQQTVVFPSAFQNAPVVIFQGGATDEERAKWGATIASANAISGNGSGTDARPSPVMIKQAFTADVTASAATANLVLIAKGSPVVRSASHGSGTITTVGGASGSATPAAAHVPSLTGVYTTDATLRVSGGTGELWSAQVVVAIELSVDGGAWVEIATETFGVLNDFFAGANVDTAVSVPASSAQVAGGNDSFRMKLKSISQTVPAGIAVSLIYAVDALTWPQDATAKYASATPDGASDAVTTLIFAMG